MLKGMEGSVLGIWIAHGEGQSYFNNKVKILKKFSKNPKKFTNFLTIFLIFFKIFNIKNGNHSNHHLGHSPTSNRPKSCSSSLC